MTGLEIFFIIGASMGILSFIMWVFAWIMMIFVREDKDE